MGWEWRAPFSRPDRGSPRWAVSIGRATVKPAAAGLRYRMHPLADVEAGELAVMSVVGISRITCTEMCRLWVARAASAAPARLRAGIPWLMDSAKPASSLRDVWRISLSTARRAPGARAR
jgi:hypothetical protein